MHELPDWPDSTWQGLGQTAYQTARRLRLNNDDAMDVAALSSVRLLTSILRLGPPDNAEAFITVVARNLAINTLAGQSRHAYEPLSEAFDQGDTQMSTPQEHDLRNVPGFSKLPRRQQEALTYLYKDDCDEETAARRMGISKETLRKHRKRGLRFLRRNRPVEPNEGVN